VSEPTTHHQPPPTSHQHNHNHNHNNNKNRRVKNTITMAATSAASAAATHQRPNLSPLDTMLSTLPAEKNGISEPSSIGILRCRVDSSSTGCDGPSGHAEATARISLSRCGHAPNPSPSIDIDAEG
jgi:hypothetical protein